MKKISAPRCLDGRPSVFLWPAGHPVAYWDAAERGPVCGICAAAKEAEGVEFTRFDALTESHHFLCNACGRSFAQEGARYLGYPMPGGRPTAWRNDRALIMFSGRRIFPLEWENLPGPKTLADLGPWNADLARAKERRRNGMPLSVSDHQLLVDRGLITAGSEGSTFIFTPRHVVYPYLSSIPGEGIAEDDPRYDRAMAAIDLFQSLHALVGDALQLLEDKRWDEGLAALRGLRRIEPKHFETWARLALALETAGRAQESEWEWLGLAEAYDEAGFHEHASLARDRCYV